MYAEKKVMAR